MSLLSYHMPALNTILIQLWWSICTHVKKGQRWEWSIKRQWSNQEEGGRGRRERRGERGRRERRGKRKEGEEGGEEGGRGGGRGRRRGRRKKWIMMAVCSINRICIVIAMNNTPFKSSLICTWSRGFWRGDLSVYSAFRRTRAKGKI